jgi:hypothetical protein
MHPWILSGLITFGALQVGDYATTERAVRAGAVEQNPILQGSNRRRILIKAGLTAGVAASTIMLPKKTGITMIWGLNGVYAGVIVHNVRVARHHEAQQR